MSLTKSTTNILYFNLNTRNTNWISHYPWKYVPISAFSIYYPDDVQSILEIFDGIMLLFVKYFHYTKKKMGQFDSLDKSSSCPKNTNIEE